MRTIWQEEYRQRTVECFFWLAPPHNLSRTDPPLEKGE
jgi:hypothetical protein